MNLDEFWLIVDRVHLASQGDMDLKCRLLADALHKLTPEEVQSFEEHFTKCWHRAYTWKIWDAAYIINGGCSDDSFMDFRATLISLGCSTYEAALADADSLAECDINPTWATYEGYQYVAVTVYKEITGKEVSPANLRSSARGGRGCNERVGNVGSFSPADPQIRLPGLGFALLEGTASKGGGKTENRDDGRRHPTGCGTYYHCQWKKFLQRASW